MSVAMTLKPQSVFCVVYLDNKLCSTLPPFAEVYKWVTPAGGTPMMHQHISGFIRREQLAVYKCLSELTPQPILSRFSLNTYENSLKPPLNLASSDNYFKSYLKPPTYTVSHSRDVAHYL